jgi:hemerythrin-like domain-containing protein
MPKRHSRLIPLTHDHHHALAQARRLRVAAGETSAQRLDQASQFLHFFSVDTIGHFRKEEEILFPLGIDDPEAAPLLGRVVVDHLRIHALVARLRGQVNQQEVTEAVARQVADALEAHIRLEEGELFPLLEKVVPEDRLGELVLNDPAPEISKK